MMKMTACGLAIVLAAAARAEGSDPAAGTISNNPDGAGEHSPVLPSDRLALPEFDFEAFQALLVELRGSPVVVSASGEEVSLSEYRGRPVLLYFSMGPG